MLERRRQYVETLQMTFDATPPESGVYGRPADSSTSSDERPERASAWLPTLNDYQGWYGRFAFPGDVKLALVGEVVNDRRAPADGPALYGGVSGLFLWKALASAGVKLHECYYTNAIKHARFTTDLKAELEGEVCPEKIIALGTTASKLLFAAGVSHYHIPHPAYWKRWHDGEYRIYVALLKEIAF